MPTDDLIARRTPTKIDLPDRGDAKNYMAHAGRGPVRVQLRYFGGIDSAECVSTQDLTKLIDESDSSLNRRLFIHPDLHDAVHSFVENTAFFADRFGDGYGSMEYIGHIGAEGPYRTTDEGEVSPSWHYEARALDIAWVGWKGPGPASIRQASRPCNGPYEASSSVTMYRRLVAVEAGLRKWFGTVLNRNWNTAHHDHFHVDCGQSVRLDLRASSSKRSHVHFIQGCIDAFTDYRVGSHDGIYSTETERGFKILLADLGMEDLRPQVDVNQYYLFLDYIMIHGFADERAGAYRWQGTWGVL